MELVLALVAVFGTLAGVVVTKILDRTDEGGRWMRDHRSASYLRFVNEFQAMRQILRQIALTSRPSDAWTAVRGRRRAQWEKYNAALVEIELFGTPDVYQAALRVDSGLRALSVWVTDDERLPLEWHGARRDVDEAMRDFVDIARVDWKLKPLGSRSGWVDSAPSSGEVGPLADS